MQRNYVTYLSPGTFIHESTTQEIESWDVDAAAAQAHSIRERHGATPFAFFFTTQERGEDDWKPRTVCKSGTYYLGGKILTLDEIKAKNDPEDDVLITNMELNGWNSVVVNDNSWRMAQPLKADDVVLDWQVESC